MSLEPSSCVWKVLTELDHVCKQSKNASNLSPYLSKQIWTPSDRSSVLEGLAQMFVDEPQVDVGSGFRPLLLDIVYRAYEKIKRQNNAFQKQSFCVSLSKYLQWTEIKRFCLEYMKENPSFIQVEERLGEPRKKKLKKSKVDAHVLCRAAWLFTRHLGDSVLDWIPLSVTLGYIHDSQDNDTRWFAAHCVMELQNMSASDRQTFLQKYFTDKLIHSLTVRHERLLLGKHLPNVEQFCVVEKLDSVQTHTRHAITEEDLSDMVVCVGGVLLPKVKAVADVEPPENDLLYVPSTQSSLHGLALAVSSGRPVLLQGAVGAGKTCLVEHLARLTGRVRSPQLMKIQLGDQMDSKALLGTYRCTEVVGEFIWQPGVLTQAVTNGYWVLLEDIDCAPMEVISVLMPLLETRCLSVPGHGENIKAAPGFQLFATQRLLGGKSGWHRQQAGRSVLLEKMWSVVMVTPLNRKELSQVICAKYPQLATVVEKLLDIYFLLSAGDHDNTEDIAMDTDADPVPSFISYDGRLVSTRDLMNWCKRIAKDFDVKSTATANLVFQEAVDCFLASISKPGKRAPAAEAIGAKLNVNKVKVEYFGLTYKPEVKITLASLSIGRAVLQSTSHLGPLRRSRSTFSFTRQASVLLERVAVCVMNCEPVLLVGETGTGKTSCVQYLAEQLGHTLHVVNMNQQSDSADLLGGFKPVDLRLIIKPFFEDFELQFLKSFSRKQNAKFVTHLQDCFGKRKWDTLFSLMDHTTKAALQKFESAVETHQKWQAMENRLKQLKIQVHQTQNALAFAFIEGTLVKAIRNGDWVLLDEINLAAMETLECLSGLLESQTGSVVLIERGDVEPVVRHKDFRLFACMNPATDVGKKDLSPGIRNRFTELFVDELEEMQDLKILVSDYLRGLSLNARQVEGIVKFYLLIRNEATKKLTDGTGHPPHFSLRTLCRALRFAASNSCFQVSRSLYEGFCLSFLTQLDRSSHPVVEQLVCQHIIGKSNVKSVLKQKLPVPPGGKYLNFEGYWVSVGSQEPEVPDNYILTPSVRANLKDLTRVVSAGHHPVLLQGETSVGKTSLITWLAQSSGNVCVRVNNHEHTDLQEYVGCYAADESGKLVFKEGVLVEAMRKGHWIILDELNLAPTDVLEALNRLLDDNRELYLPETQETVKAHPKFMLFATQNPPGHYGGRKMLSRAFRNRFVELHFDEIPSGELETILHQRCSIPLSYAKRLVAVMLELQTRRCGSGVFAGKLGFMTLRDLFRWAERYKCEEMQTAKFYNWDKHLAEQGYMLLAGRVRKPEEAEVIQEVIQKHFKCKFSPDHMYSLSQQTSLTTKSMLGNILNQTAAGFQHIVWTRNMRRLAVLIGQALLYREPVLLVGETGCGKTTMCQLYAALYSTVLHSVNCHLHTESADFLGGLRPVRSHSQEGDETKLFEWVDGPLVTAMKTGSMFLIDEISLADDSVLERLNSVLEPERALLLAEKGGGDGGQNEVEQVVAVDGFHVFATMNPGGDFGKKELSPALRNRFTEIWCPASSERQDLIDIVEHNLKAGVHLCNQEDGTSGIGRAILDFVHFFTNNQLGRRCTVSIRDILSWVNFINTCGKTMEQDEMELEGTGYNQLDPAVAYIHGACLVFLDGLGSGSTSQGRNSEVIHVRKVCLQFLLDQVNSMTHQSYSMKDLHLHDNSSIATSLTVTETADQFSIPPFSIPKGDERGPEKAQYALQAPGTCVNAQRVLRGLQLPRPLLLEGSPGVGKTSLVTALARASGRQLCRINLSEQTDVSDLFGADLPVEGGKGGMFAWRDGPLLQALKAGHWVVLDELNLASQSVLEGLNACLDHRAEVYIPELAKTFHIQHDKTRLFGCQNPLHQGGGRKGLPRSFLNRFTQVYIEPLSEADLQFISGTLYPDIPQEILTKMVTFNMQMHQETVVAASWGQRGGPWEFNLRDLFRWCDLLLANQTQSTYNPGEYVQLIYGDRMRTLSDKQEVCELYQKIFPEKLELYKSTGIFHCGAKQLQVGHSFLPVRGQGYHSQVPMEILHHCLQPLESVMKCVEMNWMTNLVGPQSCGKSSLVKLLASLTGNPLNVLAMNSAMDTTELLGGFEQADMTRHIEETSSEIDQMIQILCQHMLLQQTSPASMATVAKLQELRKECNESQEKDKSGSSTEELEHKRKHLQLLLSLLQHCRAVAKDLHVQHDMLEDIPDLKKRLKSLKEALASEKPGITGGTFEWVDSLLVKSLKSGSWLLIDNVNFCSPSVLDRLNALLEPNGVLSISERGVVDGQIPTIKPHPNFRLFLSMDPKYGDISRAMRNRGVEIYVPGEEDGCPLSATDLRLMLSGLGLKSKQVFDWLTSLHGRFKEELPRGDKPVFSTLLQAVNTLEKQVGHGVSLSKALWSACYTVYVQCQRHKATKQMAQEVLTEHFNKWTAVENKLLEEPELGVFPVRLPDTEQYRRDPAAAGTRCNVSVLVHLIEELKTSTEADSRASMLVKRAVALVTELMSPGDWQQTVAWLHAYLQAESQPVAMETYTPVLKSLGAVLTCVQGSLKDMGYQNILTQLTESGLSLMTDSRFDLQWNQQALYRVVTMSDRQENQSRNVFLPSDLALISNRAHTLLRVLLQLEYMRGIQQELQVAIATDKKRSRSSLHPAIVHIACLFDAMETVVKDCIPKLHLESYDAVVKTLEGIRWLECLLSAGLKVVGALRPQTRAELSLYWKWCRDRTLPIYSDCQTSSSQQIAAIISHLELYLGHDDSRRKLFIKFWRSWGHPGPFRSEGDAVFSLEVKTLEENLNVYVQTTSMLLREKVETVTRRRQYILQSFATLRELDAAAREIIVTQMMSNLEGPGSKAESVLDRIVGHVTGIDQSPDGAREAELPVAHVQLWPVFEHISVMAEWRLMSILLLDDVKFGDLSAWVNFCSQYTPATPSHLHAFGFPDQQLLQKTAWCVRMVLEWLRRSAALSQPTRWLTWQDTTDTRSATEENVVKQEKQDKHSIHAAMLSYAMFMLLSGNQGDRHDNKHVLTAPLDGYTREISKLTELSTQIWSHASVYSSGSRQARYLERSSVLAVFYHLLDRLVPLAPADQQSSLTDRMSELSEALAGGRRSSEMFSPVKASFSTLPVLEKAQLQDLMAQCFSSVEKVITESVIDLKALGTAWAHMGLLLVALLVPKGPVDPVEKNAIKLQLLEKEMEELDAELEVRCMRHRLVTGQELTDVSPRLVHPRIPFLLNRQREITLQIEQLSDQVAYRPTPSVYERLIQEGKICVESICSQHQVSQLLTKLESADVSRHKAGNQVLQEVELWEKSVEKFMEMLEANFRHYSDITSPLLTGVQQVLHGVSLVRQCVKQRRGILSLVQLPHGASVPDTADATRTLEALILTLGSFPTVSRQHPDCLCLATTLTSDETLTLMNSVCRGTGKDEHVKGQLSISAMRSSLKHLENEVTIGQELNPDLLVTLTRLMEMFVTSWQSEERLRKQKEEEASSLYRYKDRIHGDERSEEQRLEDEFRENFPGFEQHFADLVQPSSLEETRGRHRDEEPMEEEEEAKFHVTDSDKERISQVHHTLFTKFVQTDWFSPVETGSVQLHDWVSPVLTSYTSACTLGTALCDKLSSSLDGQLVGGHLVVSSVQKSQIAQSSAEESSTTDAGSNSRQMCQFLPRPSVYDLYHDCNIPEVIQCEPILTSFVKRVNELQKEWPDHPTLRQLCDVVERIRSFPVTSPVMKFLTGLELLLHTAQDWESNAAHHVSLATQLGEISAQIICWRKLELSCWNQSLDNAVTRCRQKASRWWFYIYQLVQSVLQPQADATEAQSDADVIVALKQFMEKSTLGEYHTRLDLLLSFHCQLVTMETSEKQGFLVNLLWNLHQFYSQFSPLVAAEIARLRAPIQKELKGFVKIARWSDLNYWALKQATEKTHRTMHKHIKQFQDVLEQPVAGTLAETQGDSPAQGGGSAWRDSVALYEQDLIHALNTFKMKEVSALPSELSAVVESLPLQCRLPSLTQRLTRHWRQVVTHTKYPSLTVTLDEFIGEVIEGVHELQAMEVTKGNDKEKQKSEAKHITLKKRKALSELFRSLSSLGLSYRKGLVSDQAVEGRDLLTPAFDVDVVAADLQASNSHGYQLPAVWEGCTDYYYRCVARKAQFATSLTAPSRELGVGNIERCKGFTEHLHRLVVQQYTDTAHLSHTFLQIRSQLDAIERLGREGEKQTVLPQGKLQEWMGQLKALVVQLLEGLNQFLVILHCCPEHQGEATLHPSPLPGSDLAEIVLVRKGAPIWDTAVQSVQDLIKEVTSSQAVLLKTARRSMFTRCDVGTLTEVVTAIKDMVPKMTSVSKLFSNPESGEPSCLNQVLEFLSDEVECKSAEFDSFLEEICDTECQSEVDVTLVKEFCDKVEGLTSEVLIVVQKLSKEHLVESETSATETRDEEDDLKEGHLVHGIYDNLQKDNGYLQCDKVQTVIQELLSEVTSLPGETGRLCLLSLSRCLPLLQQYAGIVHHQLVNFIASQRTMGKLLSVLLGLFTELLTKGFCIPPEFSDETEGEGATEFCDIEGGGIGEGEGVKDVSEQLESEDQLDDAKRPEDRQQEDQGDQPDVKAEDNAIEMSEDFEGKMQDQEMGEGEDNQSEDEKEEEELEKQMGEVDEEEADKLDEQMWGSDEEDGPESEDAKEEFGPGDGKQSEPELVAKDDNQDKSQDDEKSDEKEENQSEEKEDSKPHNLDQLDQEDYDDDHVDPYHGEQEQQQQAPDEMDLPDDLHLDEDDKDTDGKEEEEREGEAGDDADDTELPSDKPPEDLEADHKEAEQEEEESANQDQEMPTEEDKEGGKEEEEKELKEREEEAGEEKPGFSAEDNPDDQEQPEADDTKTEDKPQAVEHYGKKSHDTEVVEQSDSAMDQAGQADDNQEETDGTGAAMSEQTEGHEGQTSSKMAASSSERKRKQHERQPGKSDTDRSLGSTDQKYKKLKTVDNRTDPGKGDDDSGEQKEADMYEHVKDSQSHHDTQALDAATSDQLEQQQPVPSNEEEASDLEEGEEVKMEEDREQKEDKVEEISAAKLKPKLQQDSNADIEGTEDNLATDDSSKTDILGEMVSTMTVARGNETTIHTAMEHLYIDSMTADLEKLRADLETQLGTWDQSNIPGQTESVAAEVWHRYEALTSSLSRDLCEQLRLVLEPSQATKLKGDYRTGKRLNMRKVIPYIASQFRKDKIWLRRTKPSKRQYQIMLAIDDSSSMVDNHSKQLAFESLALVSNALTLLEAGDLSICSFGETVNVLHPFTEKFSSQSGAHLLQYLTFEQKKTKIAQLLKQATALMLDARAQKAGMLGSPETSQLLLIVSDGRGLFLEGMEVVKSAVRQAREANVFLVFIILDNPENKDSILDIKVPVFKSSGEIPEIKSYMDHFPFPFYIILRDINSLPQVLSDALRQWFELVTSVDR